MITNTCGFRVKIFGGNDTEELLLDNNQNGSFKKYQSKITGLHCLIEEEWHTINHSMLYDHNVDYNLTVNDNHELLLGPNGDNDGQVVVQNFDDLL